MQKDMITVQVEVFADIEKVWQCWTQPDHITRWNFASDDWICPKAINDLQPGGEFNWRMEARDGSMGFDFTGIYNEIKDLEQISYTIADGRKVEILFSKTENGILLTEAFEAEGTNSDELQRKGWQAILQNFKKHVEAN